MRMIFLKYLICPYCKSKFNIKIYKEKNEHIIEGLLICKCGNYKITRGIPRIFRQIMESSQTAQVFGQKWNIFPKINTFHENQFLDWITPIEKSFFKNKVILDGGCGQGRHTYFSAEYGAKVIFGVDLSDAVEIAFKHTKDKENVCIIQSDIYKLPFKQNFFDYVYCIGVLHHLPRPQEGFNKLLRHLKKNGKFSLWVYGSQGYLVKIFDLVRKKILSKLSLEMNLILSQITAAKVYLMILLLYKPLNNRATRKIARSTLPQYTFFIYLSKFKFKMIHEIIFDQFIAPVAFYYSFEDFRKWFLNDKTKSYKITERNNNSWRGLVIKS